MKRIYKIHTQILNKTQKFESIEKLVNYIKRSYVHTKSLNKHRPSNNSSPKANLFIGIVWANIHNNNYINMMGKHLRRRFSLQPSFMKDDNADDKQKRDK